MAVNVPEAGSRYRSITFVPLFEAPDDVWAAETVLGATNPAARCPARAVTMPQTGFAFFEATGEEARQLDRVWAQVVPPDSCPVVVLLHDDRLPAFLDGLDAAFVVGCPDAQVARAYEQHPHVQVVLSGEPAIVLRAAMEAWNSPGDPCFSTLDPVPAAHSEALASQAGDRLRGEEQSAQGGGTAIEAGREPDFFDSIFEPPPQTRSGSERPPDGADAWGSLGGAERLSTREAEPVPGHPVPDAWPSRLAADPLAALAALRPVTVERTQREAQRRKGRARRAVRGIVERRVEEERRSEDASADETARGFLARARAILAGRRPIEVPGEIGDLLLGTRPAPLVVVGSRKGGVGKTALSAGLAQVAGYSLDGRAGLAALVDQNINNADQWGRLMLPEGVTTVRQIMSQLENGLGFPGAPAYARTPALAVFPESRDPGDGYPPLLIQQLCRHLRERFVLSVIDLPNTLPAMTSAEASVTYHYVAEADLVLVPTTDDPNALRGVIEYLDAPSMRQKTVVVPYIVSTEKGIRDHPKVIDLLDRIRSRSAAVVPFPKTEKATLAVVKGASVLDVDTRLRNAYIDLAAVVARILVRTV